MQHVQNKLVSSYCTCFSQSDHQHEGKLYSRYVFIYIMAFSHLVLV
jgi:hypothetical protein